MVWANSAGVSQEHAIWEALAETGTAPKNDVGIGRIARQVFWNDARQGAESVFKRAYLTDVLTKIVNGHPNSQLDQLLPWAYAEKAKLRAVVLEHRLL
jgi:hypothetical protein